jgi:GWxTD domain-containing protein
VFVRPRLVLLVLAAACVWGSAHPQPSFSASQPERAEVLRRKAAACVALNTFESRRKAMEYLEQATLLDPGRPDLHLDLGRLYERVGFLKEARKQFERASEISPEDADAKIGIARLWRRDWLKFLDPRSLTLAIVHLEAAAKMRPGDAEVALNLVPLLLERGRLDDAAAMVARARAATPHRNDVKLADALVSYRQGRIEHCDSAFAFAVPRLTRPVRQRFEDIAPLASERDTMTLHRLPPDGQAEFVRRFWADHDPDLATPANEARLAYWARCAQAYFLYYDTRLREWDERGEVYVRYGPPAAAAYNPVGMRLSLQMSFHGTYPLNALVWAYPDLGMEVVMQDRLLTEYYRLPMTFDYDPDPVPDPAAVARDPSRFATRSGRGVFPTLPPGVHPVPVDGVVARFEGANGVPRLLSLVETPGTPGDSSRAQFVVLDSTRREVARGDVRVSPSACDPAASRVADYAAELPPGEYLVGFTIDDGRGGRGVLRQPVKLVAPDTALALSDVVVSCGRAADQAGPEAVRLSANPSARVMPGQPLTAYFEIYHLLAGGDGLARVEFEYTVRSTARDPRVWLQRLIAPRKAVPEISSRREDVQTGDLRRQFVEVPIDGLPAGPYRLDITVRDLISHTEVTGSAPFLKGDIESATR